MEIDDKPIKEFVNKHGMDWQDEWMQAKLIVEEANEVRDALLQYGGYSVKKEVADVIITTMVFAELAGWLEELPDLIAEKMKINLEKPVGRKPGEKVRKQ